MELSKIANQSILDIAPYVAGKSIESVARDYGIDNIIKLASNENPFGPSPKAITAIEQALPKLALYPDSEYYELRQALAKYYQLSIDQIIVGNGSDNLFHLIALVFAGPDYDVVFSQYAFANYMITTKAHMANPTVVSAKNWGHDLPAMAEKISKRCKIVFLANPNNPTGTLFNHDEFVNFMETIPRDVIVVVDEAYYEFIKDLPQAPDTVSLLEKFENIFITRTFSKAHGLAGLRIGYGIGHPDVIALMQRVRLPFNLNHLGEVAAIAALDDTVHIEKTVKHSLDTVQCFQQQWSNRGLDYIPSYGNFSTVCVGTDAMGLFQRLLRRGIIVRPLHPYGMSDYLRISVGLPHENERLLETISEELL